jgi:5-methylcytosine-specific restriction protein A
MPAFILTWHPRHFRWEEHGYHQAIQSTTGGQLVRDDWTVGNRTGGISPGNRAYLYRQHDNRGIVASGVFTSGVEARAHWDGSGRTARYADLDWGIVLDYEDRLPLEVLNREIPQMSWGHLQGSGIEVKPEAAPKLHAMWQHHTGGILFRSPDEPRSHEDLTFPEGAVSRVEVNRYERDPRARRACLQHWGCRCTVCGFSFEESYGPVGRDYIHVHHLVELSRLPAGYEVHPVDDLRPVCPNCHAMIHHGPGPALTIDELRQRLRRQG